MFSDPSGLAPEGEKNNKTQGLGDDAIVAGQTIGYWSLQNTLYIDYRAVRDFEDSRGTSYVYSFSMSTSLEESYVWVTTRGIGGISDTRAGSASIDSPSEMWGTDRYRGSTSTKKYIDPNSLRSKSMRDQIYNEASFGNQSGSMVSISTSVCAECGNNNSSNFKTPDYNLYTKDGKLNPNFKGDGLESNDLDLIGLYSFTKALLKNGVKSLSKLIFGNNAAKTVGKFKFPGNNPAKAPKGFEWKGKPGSTPGSKDGNWYNPKTGESLRPDLNHPNPIGPHWDYKDPSGKWWRIFSDGSNVPK